MTQGLPQGGWAPPPAGWQPQPPAGPSRGPLLATGIAAAVLGFLQLLIGVLPLAGVTELIAYFPMFSLLFTGTPLPAVLGGLVGIAGGGLLIARFGWARFLIVAAAALSTLEVLGSIGLGFVGGRSLITPLFYAVFWLGVGVAVFLPPVGRALKPAGPVQPMPQQFGVPQQFPPPGPPQQFPPPGPPPQQFQPPGYPQR